MVRMPDLTDLDRQVLAFAARRYRSTEAHDDACLVELGMGPTRYAHLLTVLLDSEDAYLAEPQLVARLRRLRDERRRRRGRAA